jgi:hypothetical protein
LHRFRHHRRDGSFGLFAAATALGGLLGHGWDEGPLLSSKEDKVTLCLLCLKTATQGHMASGPHKKRMDTFLGAVLQAAWSETPILFSPRGHGVCLMCSKQWTQAHYRSRKHTSGMDWWRHLDGSEQERMIEEWVQSLPANFFADMESAQEVLARGLERLRAMGYAIPDPDSLLHHWQRLPEGLGDGSGPADLTRDPPWPKGGFREMAEANRAKWEQEGADGSDGDEADPTNEPQALQATPRSLQKAPENPRRKKCECGRFVIGTASGAYCCPRCRDTQGASHSARCEADTAALDRLGAIAVREKAHVPGGVPLRGHHLPEAGQQQPHHAAHPGADTGHGSPP